MPNLYVECGSDQEEKFTHPQFNIIKVNQFGLTTQNFRPYPNSHYRGTIYGYVNHKTDHFISLTNFRANKLNVLGPLYLNYSGQVKTFLDVKRGWDGDKFVKSNSGTKLVSGQVINFDNFIKDYGYKLSDDDLLLIADPIKIEKEFRCFVSDRLITCSVYIENDVIVETPVEKYEQKILEDLCEAASKLYRPAPIFVCDIVKTCSGEYKVVEYNCWNCSGIYCCDATKILEELLHV